MSVNKILAWAEYGLTVVDRTVRSKLQSMGIEPIEYKEEDGTILDLYLLEEVAEAWKPKPEMERFYEDSYVSEEA